MSRLMLSIGGFNILCVSDDPVLNALLASQYSRFRALSGLRPHLRLQLYGMRGLPDEPWREPVVRFNDALVSVTAPGLAAEWDCTTGNGTLGLTGAPPMVAVEYVLRVACMTLAVWYGAVVGHAAAVVAQNGLAYLFWGASGAGKSTAARLSVQAGKGRLLNDDLVVLRRAPSRNPLTNERRNWQAHGTPFTNPTQAGPGRPDHAPVRAVLHLSQEPEPVVRPMGAADALSRVVSGIPVVMSDSGWAARALTTAIRLVQEVPQYQLGFRPDAGFWTVLDRTAW